MTLEQIREWEEFRNAVDGKHCKEIADELDRSRTVYYLTEKGYGTNDITEVLDMIEQRGSTGYLDGYIEIEVHYKGIVKPVEIPVEIAVENWLEDCQCFEVETVTIKDIEEW